MPAPAPSPPAIPPGSVIGILGGGQLGRMTALAAARLGYLCHVYSDVADSPAAQVTPLVTVAGFEDGAALDRFAARVDVITLEWENIPAASLRRLAAGKPVRPHPEVVATTQDRLTEKGFLNRHGFPTAAWFPVSAPGELAAALDAIGTPSVLKSARLGYDGKGQALIRDPAAAGEAWIRMGGTTAILEAFVPFACEISVIAARAVDGTTVTYPAVENIHLNHILARTLVPARIPPAIAAAGARIAAEIARALDVVGLIAVELFVTAEGGLLVNELAPRPHNSGHWTLDAAATSQFEQLVRAVCGLPLGDPRALVAAEMINLLGEDADRWWTLLTDPRAKLHLYGKRDARPGRKMGHVTRLLPADAAVDQGAAPGTVSAVSGTTTSR